MKKILFITHVPPGHFYGAQTSLELLTKNLVEYRKDMIFPKGSLKFCDQGKTKNRFGIDNMYELYLPSETCYIGTENKSKTSFNSWLSFYFLKFILKNILKKMKLFKSRFNLMTLISRNKYDWIYLNSLVLYPLISPRFSYVIHVREVWDCSDKAKVLSKMYKSSKVIFIDNATAQPFIRNNIPEKYMILSNPCDMKELASRKKPLIKGIEKDDIVFSIIGTIDPGKGTEFVIKAFQKVINPEYKLLIIGKTTDTHYQAYLKDLTKNDKRIIWYGETSLIKDIYLAVDYVIRSDLVECIGRTVIEGLYAGCFVVLQGSREYYKKEIINEHLEKCFFYSIRNEESFISILIQCDKKAHYRKFHSNIEEYISRFQLFLKKN